MDVLLTREERVGRELVAIAAIEEGSSFHRERVVLVSLKCLDRNATYVILPSTGIRSASILPGGDH